jgi:dTDP-4-dehydrorhamnose 3,5-epimerase
LLQGIRVLELKKNIDERGMFSEIFRNNWSDFFDSDQIIQANLSISYPGMVRAWHRHGRGQVDYFLVIQGSIKICAYDDKKQHIDEIVSSSEKLQLVRIPGYYWHGFKNVANTTSTVIYFVNKLYNYEDPDEERRPWNDPQIKDQRTGNPFDWNRLPYQ